MENNQMIRIGEEKPHLSTLIQTSLSKRAENIQNKIKKPVIFFIISFLSKRLVTV